LAGDVYCDDCKLDGVELWSDVFYEHIEQVQQLGSIIEAFVRSIGDKVVRKLMPKPNTVIK
jgi:hypothetical protein